MTFTTVPAAPCSRSLVGDFESEFGVNQDGVISLVAHDGLLYEGFAGPGVDTIVFAYDGTTWLQSLQVPGCSVVNLSVIDDEVWAGSHGECGARVFRRLAGDWVSVGSMNETGVFDLVRYGDFIYATTLYNGRIYAAPLAAPGSSLVGGFGRGHVAPRPAESPGRIASTHVGLRPERALSAAVIAGGLGLVGLWFRKTLRRGAGRS